MVGKNRADHIVGSYAVYHKSKNHNQYQTGKFAHIYRPLITDAKGQEVFADLNIKNNIMSIVIPQTFLDQATYPVKVDPTFGYSTAGASDYQIATANNYTSLLGQEGLNGNLTSLSVYVGVIVSTAPLDLTLTLYSFSDNILRDYTASQSFSTSSAAGWLTYPTSQNYLTLFPTLYNIGLEGYIATTGGYNAFNIYYDTTATTSGGISTSNTYSTPPPSTQPVYTYSNDRFSFYANIYEPVITKGNFLPFM